MPWRWWAGPDSDPELPVQLLSGGAELAQTQPVMAVDLDRVTPGEPVPGLDIREVRLAGWLDGQIVASSVLLDRCGVARVYAVTTADGYRRHGIGAAMTAAALRVGRERGRRIGTLQASSMGQPALIS